MRSKLFTANKYFWLGLLLRIACIFFLIPTNHTQWFSPFLSITLPSLHWLNPWSIFLAQQNSLLAFPYGITMYWTFAPLGAIANILHGFNFSFGLYASHLVIGFTILFFDFFTLIILSQFTNNKKAQVIFFYWLSPIVIFISYIHGQIDIIPVFFVLLSLYGLVKGNGYLSGMALAIGIVAKLSMMLIWPIIFLYLLINKRVRFMCFKFALSSLALSTLLLLPYIWIPDFMAMVFKNPEISKATLLSLALGPNTKLFLLPIAYTLFIFMLCRLRRMNMRLLFAAITIAFVLVLTLTAASIGWYYWILPFIVLYQVYTANRFENQIIMYSEWLFTLMACSLFLSLKIVPWHFTLNFNLQNYSAFSQVLDWWYSGVAILLTILASTIFVNGIRNNDYYRLSRKPLTIGISGDSGSGKDTFSEAMASLFNATSVTSISGDDYHKWDRYAPMWRYMTHLNPHANDLEQFAKDVIQILEGKPIVLRQYNHETGRFEKGLNLYQNDLILVSGLHALHSPLLRAHYDLKIFLQMDEALRHYLKLRRDVFLRGHTEEKVLTSIAKRNQDAQKYLVPQTQFADIVFSLSVVNEHQVQDYKINQANITLCLKAILKNSLYYPALIRILQGTYGLMVEYEVLLDGSEVHIAIEGEIPEDAVKSIAEKLLPHLEDLLSYRPKWSSGMTGVMQLITLMHLSQIMQNRLI